CLGGIIGNPICMGSRLDSLDVTMNGDPSIQTMSGIGMWAKEASQCEGAVTLSAALSKAHQVLEFMRPFIEQGTAPLGCGDVLLPLWRDALFVVTGSSIDPNDKLGARKALSITQAAPYTVLFENESIAAFPAHHVRVVDNLDLSKLDPSSIVVGPVTIA